VNRRVLVVAALIARGDEVLVARRKEAGERAGLWEFPGGKVEPGESDEEALRRELRERLDADATIGKKIGEKHHAYQGYEVEVALYAATLDEKRPLLPRRVKDFRWVTSSEFEQYPFPDADQATMDQLLGIPRPQN